MRTPNPKLRQWGIGSIPIDYIYLIWCLLRALGKKYKGKVGVKSMEGAATGMAAVITALKSTLTLGVFFDVIKECVPFLAIMVPVALGYGVLRRMIKGAGRGRVSF